MAERRGQQGKQAGAVAIVLLPATGFSANTFRAFWFLGCVSSFRSCNDAGRRAWRSIGEGEEQVWLSAGRRFLVDGVKVLYF